MTRSAKQIVNWLRTSLGPSHTDRFEAVAAALCSFSVTADSLETSVRVVAGAAPSGNRMMLERLTPESARTLLGALDPESARSPMTGKAFELARDLALPLIAGWDAGAAQLKTKLYLNASDASDNSRRLLASRLKLDQRTAPHVVGFNMAGSELELKVYQQYAEVPKWAPDYVRVWAPEIQIAGVVSSHTVTADGLKPKAWFIAPRPAPPDVSWNSLKAFRGWDGAAVRKALPFPPGMLTSVGWGAGGSECTAYFKCADATALSWSLEPVLCVASESCELGVFVEPNDNTAKAYARTRSHAISYRIRSGQSQPHDVESLMDWVLNQIESHDKPETALSFSSPPKPWHVVRQSN